MTIRRSTPPRLAERLLEMTIRGRVARAGLVGDLREQFAARERTESRLRTSVWYWWQALSASVAYCLEYIRIGWREFHRPSPGIPRRKDMTMLARLIQDLRYAVRMLRKAPGMAAIAIVALMLGTGLPTIMFTIVNGVLRDLPVEQGERIVQLYRTGPQGGRGLAVSHHDYADWSEQQTTFEAIGGFDTEDVTLSGNNVSPIRRNGAFVTSNMFALLRVQPILGRDFTPTDASPASNPVVLISNAVWHHRFSGDESALGRVVTVDGVRRTIVGVMPDWFAFPFDEDLWFPLAVDVRGPRGDGPFLQVVGRIADGATFEGARAELNGIAQRIGERYPEIGGGDGAGLIGYTDGQLGAEVAGGLYTMLAVVSFVLLIACANVANLLLARAVVRSKEVAVRAALGASRSRVAFQFLVESFVIAAVGGLLGTAVAYAGVHLFNQAMAPFIGVAWVDIRIDATVLAFVLSMVLLASLFAGLLPALQASGTQVSEIIKDQSRGTSSMRLGRFSRGLVVFEIALSCALLVVSGLMIKGVMRLHGVDLGMPVANIVTGEVELPSQIYATTESRVQFFEDLEARLQVIPGAEAVALMSDIPGTGGADWPILIDGITNPNDDAPRHRALRVTPSFLEVLDAPVVEGRGFTDLDRPGNERTALVNRAFARRYFPDRSAIGRTFRFGGDQPQITIVGMVPDLYMGGIEEEDANGPGIYIPYAQSAHVSMQVMVRTAGDPLALTSQIRETLESLDPTLALMDVERVDRIISRGVLQFEVFGRLFLFFGLTALFLASVGLYGVMAFNVSQRTREWGVRMALGARSRDVIGMVVKQGLRQVALGLAIGLVLAGALSVPMADIFFHVDPWDRSIFAIIALILAGTSVVATIVPARRATRVDPMEAVQAR